LFPQLGVAAQTRSRHERDAHVFTYETRADGDVEQGMPYLILDPKSLGSADHPNAAYRTPLCNEEVDFAAAGIWGSMATWEDPPPRSRFGETGAQGTRWILTPIWGPPHSEFKPPVSHGPVTHGAIVALKLEDREASPC
jgi:hypothetical protein